MDMGSDSNVHVHARHPSFGHRKFALYASRTQNSDNDSSPVQSPSTDATPAAVSAPDQHHAHAYGHDHGHARDYRNFSYHSPTPSENSIKLSQLPPLPISPRWDSLSNSSRFFMQSQSGSQTASNPASPLDPTPHSPSTLDATTNASETQTQSQAQAAAQIQAVPISPTFTLSPLVSHSSLADLRVLDNPPVENFSRPRKQSIRQPIIGDPPKIRPVNANFIPAADPYQEIISSPQQAPWSRPRGPSVSSSKSTATFHSPSIASPPIDEFPESYPSRARATTAAASTSPGLPFNFSSNIGSSPSRSPAVAPWMNEEELRASYRSQFTESTAPGTTATERSSVLTKDSSVTSIYPPADIDAYDEDADVDPDEPSLEDVMGMYEAGFGDDDSVFGDHVVHDTRPESTVSDNDLPNIGQDFTGYESEPPTEPTSALDAEIRMSKMIFKSPAFTSSVPHIAENFHHRKSFEKREIFDKRDSGKSLASEPSIASQQQTPVEVTAPISPPISPPTVPVEPEDPDSRDRYGFKKANQYITRQQYDTWNAGYTEYLARRRRKWHSYLKDSALMTDHPNRFPAPNAKTKRFVRKGIPPEWRGAAWFYYAGGPAILAKHSGLYDKLITKEAKPVDVEAIERDLHRTFPDNIKFKPPNGAHTATSSERSSQSTMTESTRSRSPPASAGTESETPIITSLRRVLHAFAVYNPRIGYCQSLNFIAGLLLLFVNSEEQCFWLLNVITHIYLPGTHDMSLEGSQVDLGVLMTEIRDTMPGVWDKIGGELEADPNARPQTSKTIRLPRTRRKDLSSISTDRLPPITMAMTAWFMSCFIGNLPIETTLRVWDVFFYEGSRTLFRIALTVLKTGEAEIKSNSDPMEIYGVVQAMPRKLIDANKLMEACFKRRNGFGHLSQETIDTRREERRQKAQLSRHGVVATESEVRRKGTLFGNKKRAGI